MCENMEQDIAGMTGHEVSVLHFSGKNPFRGVIEEYRDSIASLKFLREMAALSFKKGDPVILGFETNGRVLILGCNVNQVWTQKNMVALTVDKIDEKTDMRHEERYPVSLTADLRSRPGCKRYAAAVKNISNYGMLIYTDAEYEVDELVIMDLYLDNRTVMLKSKVVRKNVDEQHNEYGLGILYEDGYTLNTMKDYIAILKLKQEDAVRKPEK